MDLSLTRSDRKDARMPEAMQDLCMRECLERDCSSLRDVQAVNCMATHKPAEQSHVGHKRPLRQNPLMIIRAHAKAFGQSIMPYDRAQRDTHQSAAARCTLHHQCLPRCRYPSDLP